MQTQYDQAYYLINDTIIQLEKEKKLTHSQAEMLKELNSQALNDMEDLDEALKEGVSLFNKMANKKNNEMLDSVVPNISGDYL